MKKVLSLLVALALVMSLGLVSGTPVQAAVSQAQVTVNPVKTGEVAQYSIVFSITADLVQAADKITIDFPVNTAVPSVYSDGDIKVNGLNITSGNVEVNGQKVTVNAPTTIPAPGPVTVLFTAAANITNPPTTGDYTLYVNTTRVADQTPVESLPYAIRDVPTVTNVRPNEGNVGGTMWVVITGTSFMGNADTNASATTIGFGVGADVLKTKYISVGEINVQIYVKAQGTFAVTAQTVAGSSTTIGSFTANIAATEQVDVWQKYTPLDNPFTADTLVFGSTHSTIQGAINAAVTNYTLLAHSGVYVEDLVINKQGLTLTSISGKSVTTIKGVKTTPQASWPLAEPNIEILASGVKIHGFRIESPSIPDGRYSSGIVLTGQNIEIYDNNFVFVASGNTATYTYGRAVGIQTYRVDAMATSDISGLVIQSNAFSGDPGPNGYYGIFVNRDKLDAAGGITIKDNSLTGRMRAGIQVERSKALIQGNSLNGAGFTGNINGMWIFDWDSSRAQNDVTITGNTIKNLAGVGLTIGYENQALTGFGVTRNTIQSNGTGVLVRSSAGSVFVNYNTLSGNTGWGVENAHSAQLNARYNWWGHAIGPYHVTRNPGGQQNAVGDKALFSPWLYKPQEQFTPDAPCFAGSVVLGNEATAVTEGGGTSYVGGWNSYSAPIALDGSGNTVSKLLSLAAGSNLFILRAQRFDPATQQWVTLILNNTMIADYTIRPGEGFFIQVRDKGSLPILVATTTTVPPMRDLIAGWTLVGTSSLSKMSVSTALSGLTYSVALSPKPPNAQAWSVPPADAGTTYLQLGEAYWVAMGAPGKLFGFTYTPVAVDMTWELNQ